MPAGVSDWLISRIGTWMSGREPATYTFREFGSGLTAASSTCAVALRNLGLAFMLAPRVNQGGAAPLLMMRHASLRRHYPHQVRRVFLTRLEAFIKPARTPNVW